MTAACSTAVTGTMSIPCSVFAAIVSRAAAGTPGLVVMRSLKPVASDPSKTAPTIAVPSEDPRFWAVPWSPPASLVCVGATADMITFPAARPVLQLGVTARPDEQSGEVGAEHPGASMRPSNAEAPG